jgi:ABC-type polysaccharide/polyol phosphate transport system ATPase subunit
MSVYDNRGTIVFQGAGKSFSRHAGQMLIRERVVHLRRHKHSERFHALREISFATGHGESVAVVGHNGAGKSTLLSLATGLCEPDSGRVMVHGRAAALLELGSGFHPDLAGAGNVRINAALMGLSRREVRRKFGEIVAFAEIGGFIGEPVRTCSTGIIMMRLAFSVGVTVDPDILLIDEVLGVGDLAFCAKYQERILQFRDSGETILCVSHSTATPMSICDRALWLDHGRLMADGPIARVMDSYTAAMTAHAEYSTQ